MKHIVAFLIVVVFYLPLIAQNNNTNFDDKGLTNNFYDNSPTNSLSKIALRIEGEIVSPGNVDFSVLPKSSVIVKESIFDSDSLKFIGAYRYDGYSLLNILNYFVLNKSNAKDFPPIVDLFIEIENDKNEVVVFSWGEIFYASNLNAIILATDVMRIIPEKSKEMWELPVDCKIVCATDYISERNISNPVKITVKSYKNNSIKIVKGKNPSYSPDFSFYKNDEKLKVYNNYPENSSLSLMKTIFYGKGRGLHSTKIQNGLSLSHLIESNINPTKEAFKKGLIVLVSDDGYRTVFSYSELCNRNDGGEALLIYNKNAVNGGVFRLIAGFDFFSDRAVKSISSIYYIEQ